MRRTLVMLLAATTIAACSGGSDAEPVPLDTEPPPPVTTTTTEAPTPTIDSTEPATTEPPTTQAPATEAPATTIDEAAVLAEAEAAYREAYEVSRGALRNPDDPENETRLREHYTGANLEGALEDLRLTVDGNFILKENSDNPSFLQTYDDAEFVDGNTGLVRLTVCEFYSDRLFEIGAAPGGDDALVRDDPTTYLFVTRLELDEGVWKAQSGGDGEEIKDEEEKCSGVS